MMRTLLWALPAVTLLLTSFPARADQPAYKVLKTIKIGGEGGWDYLTMDSDGRRLYIARSDRVTVVDVDAGKVVGEVPKTQGIHGIALDLKRKHGFSSNGQDGSVSIFDLETLKETSRVKVGARPDAIIYDPASDRVFTFNAGSSDATAVSAADGTVAGTVKLGGKPEGVVVDGKGLVFVNIEDKNEVAVFDAKELTVKNRWPLAPGEKAVGLGIDCAKRRLFATCGNEKMIVLEADSGKVLATLPIGKGTDACAFDPGTGLAFSSNGAGDGTLTIVEEKPTDTYKVLANVPTQAGAHTMALDTKTHNVVLCTAKFKPAPAGAGGRRRVIEPDSFVVLIVGK